MARPVLATGRAFALNISGNSMRPFLRDGERVVLKARERYEKGDVVLGKTFPEGTVVLHYVAEVREDCYLLMGAGNIRRRELCRKSDVIGALAEPAVSRRAIRLWHLLLPFRRLLLRLL